MNKAFLKWAGGKTQSLQMITEVVGYLRGRFVEPFIGSGVVSLNVPAVGYVLGDYNKDLINLYEVLKTDKDFIGKLEKFFVLDNNDASVFYKFRAMFNETKDLELRALLFVYLNRHCFNGLCRYNKSGGFNVPFGKYKKVYFPKAELKTFKEKLLNKCELYYQSFEDTFRLLKEDDLCYCDPPYVPLSKTASFTDYSVDGFTEQQQVQLAKLAEEAPCRILISNHDTEFTRDIYSKADEIRTRKVSRFISAKAESRKPVYELLAIYNKEN